MRNDELAEIFDEIADMLELRDDNFYHQRAYRVAAESLREYPAPVAELPRDQFEKYAASVLTSLRGSQPCSIPASCHCLRNCGKNTRAACSN